MIISLIVWGIVVRMAAGNCQERRRHPLAAIARWDRRAGASVHVLVRALCALQSASGRGLTSQSLQCDCLPLRGKADAGSASGLLQTSPPQSQDCRPSQMPRMSHEIRITLYVRAHLCHDMENLRHPRHPRQWTGESCQNGASFSASMRFCH
jgi:hypothetical protein